MRAEELFTDPALAATVAAETEQLPSPTPEAREALRTTLERTERAPTEAQWPPLLETPRQKKDSRYAEPATSHRPVVGPALVLAKRAFRLAFQPFINEVLRKQVEFNEAILDSLALIYEQQRENARTQAAWRKELNERLARLDQRP
ncbi:hypothetical protein [Hyalangium versicolor]|uniref:hypothetical protein n=1 Tax=Hyalangium versicolor TaxID=2861190 RepID=UPI001CCE2FEE|nr:hypothetical protein [Hyalangium versicolor]